MIKPTVTTAISCRNHGKYLRRAIDSCLNQTLKPTDVILINDGSNDDTAKILKEVKENFKSVRTFTHTYPVGNIRSYNEAIDHAKGDYFHLMAADDVLLDSGFYETAVIQFVEDKQLGLVTTGLEWMDDNGKRLGLIATAPFSGTQTPENVLRAMYTQGNFINGGGTVIRTAVQRHIGGYDARLPYSADFYNWIKVFKKGFSGYFLKEVGYLYRRHHSQMTYGKSAPKEERDLCNRELENAMMEVLGGKPKDEVTQP